MSLENPAGEARSQISSSYSAHRLKSSSKRPLVHSDDDDDVPALSATQKTKRPRMVDDDALSSVFTDDDDDMDVDVDSALGAANDSRFLPEDNIPPLHTTKQGTSRKRQQSTSVSASAKRKTQVVYSDEESSHMERDSVQDNFSDSPLQPIEASDDDDDDDKDDYELDPQLKRGVPKEKASTAKGKTGKGKPGQLKGAQAKGSKEKDKDKEILVKDERKLAIPPPSTSRASSAAAQSQPSELFSNDDLASSSVDVLSQPIPKKRKLPPIKKTKVATGATSTPTPTTATQKPLPPPVQELAKPPLPTSEQRKQALTGVRDIDLGDHKVYAELFKGAGGNTPRSGLKNAEERRKELDKMRDEAKARRAEEAKFAFDLQSQADKIARFEQRLRAENSTVLHPNFLAAKFRDEWELERRHRRATPKEEGEA